jgi:hypothetical protein
MENAQENYLPQPLQRSRGGRTHSRRRRIWSSGCVTAVPARGPHHGVKAEGVVQAYDTNTQAHQLREDGCKRYAAPSRRHGVNTPQGTYVPYVMACRTIYRPKKQNNARYEHTSAALGERARKSERDCEPLRLGV